ncbi:EF-P lysine aminoacylase EpmA [Patescibacteria group bacterium]
MKTWKKLKKNPQLWDRYFIREKILTAIRRFFIDRDFHEVETPYLTGSLPPESYLDVFETTLLNRKGIKRKAYLPTSPEPFLKKLLAAGIGSCFSITKSFRNSEDMSLTHNPEFTILEWYRINSDYRTIMRDCEDLFIFINTYLKRSESKTSKKVNIRELKYQGKTLDLSPPWERLTVVEAFEKYADVDLYQNLSQKTLSQTAIKKGYKKSKSYSWEEIFHLIFLNEVEPRLGRGKPTIIYDYPSQVAALSRIKKSDPRFAERFEFYIEGLELGDAYSELTNWKEQLDRFRQEQKEKKRMKKTVHPIDMDFIDALKSGIPETGGIALGVDRLIMLFSDTSDISETLLFPAVDLFE